MKWKYLLLAVLMGWGFPWLILSVARIRQPSPKETADLISAETGAIDTRQELVQDNTVIPVHMDDGSVVCMELEQYLCGVVLGEMPADFEAEALKAQAVVARTYTLKHHLSQQKHPDGGLCTDYTCCQAYCTEQAYLDAGHTQAQLDKVRQAVAETQSLVLSYEGNLIDATYFSCSGGKTEDAMAVWGTEVPYLQSVDSPGEESAKHYVDTVTFSLREFRQKLDAPLSGAPENWLGEITYTDGGGVDTLELGGTVYSGTELRSLLGLRSTAFYMTVLGDTVTVTTKGFGHRVGMSQYGAEAMAVKGGTFTEILAHYYPGTTLQTWHE